MTEAPAPPGDADRAAAGSGRPRPVRTAVLLQAAAVLLLLVAAAATVSAAVLQRGAIAAAGLSAEDAADIRATFWRPVLAVVVLLLGYAAILAVLLRPLWHGWPGGGRRSA
ncbi:hypothetical protein GCM10010124_30090 [Pilimelia terevasa]|uniref:Uncharacterized protein n=1 Tax=Pilimelia terevasa TaxID=53372 RepID=A0A8J3FLL0_9ACTN|nr:hypothetical protein [Pilimelia terevasa]GGK35366.1 hypothetical protein GCM10010124_30090 [Pilimelia terevasa]